MTEHAQDLLGRLTSQLEDAATRLRSGELADTEAAALIEECARLAGEAGAELDRRARAAGDLAAPPGQDRLL